jgi:hypothetical protein
LWGTVLSHLSVWCCFRLLQATRMQAFISASFWLDARALLSNFIAREQSLSGHVLPRRVRACNFRNLEGSTRPSAGTGDGQQCGSSICPDEPSRRRRQLMQYAHRRGTRFFTSDAQVPRQRGKVSKHTGRCRPPTPPESCSNSVSYITRSMLIQLGDCAHEHGQPSTAHLQPLEECALLHFTDLIQLYPADGSCTLPCLPMEDPTSANLDVVREIVDVRVDPTEGGRRCGVRRSSIELNS